MGTFPSVSWSLDCELTLNYMIISDTVPDIFYSAIYPVITNATRFQDGGNLINYTFNLATAAPGLSMTLTTKTVYRWMLLSF